MGERKGRDDPHSPLWAGLAWSPWHHLDATAQRFAVQFGLTGAETRILVELVRGNGLLSAAAQLAGPRGPQT